MPSSHDLAQLLLEIADGVTDRALQARLCEFAAKVPVGIHARAVGRAERGRTQRDAVLRRLAIEQYPNLDLQLLADEISTDVRRYAAAGWLIDRAFPELRPQYARDLVRVRLFEAFKAADGRVPISAKQLARILKPLFQQQKSGHAEAVAMSTVSASPRVKGKQQMAAKVVNLEERVAKHLLDAVAASPEGRRAAAALVARTLADRERIAAELAGLDQEELKATGAANDERSKLKDELNAARAKVRELELKAAASTGAKLGISFSFQARRDDLKRRLRESADPAIAAFVHQIRYDEMDKLRKEQPRVDSARTKSQITGKIVGTVRTNSAAITIRMHALRRAAEDAEALYLQPDQSTVPAQLGELLRNLPDIYDMRPPPQYGSHLLLNDLVIGVPLDQALLKHCGVSK